METLQQELAALASLIFEGLKAVGSILALMAVLVVTVGMLRSIWAVTMGRATLILPFRGSEKLGIWPSGLLAQQLNEIEETWRELSGSIQSEQESAESAEVAALVDIGRTRMDESSSRERDRLIAPNPLEGQAIGPIGIGAATFSPETLFALFDMVRSKLARRIISGEVDVFGETVRATATFSTWGAGARSIVVTRRPGNPEGILDILQDVAFQISKHRLKFESDATTWAGYHTFLRGYVRHLRYMRTGETDEREEAIGSYRHVVRLEPEFHLARYHLGTLLYGSYTAAKNTEAIEHLRHASHTARPLLRALALASLARAYCQQFHRFGHPEEPWARQAEGVSAAAVELAPHLEDTWLARGFALQSLHRYQEAIEAYQQAVNLPGSSFQERNLKSLALNNTGYIYMNTFQDLDRAQAAFGQALSFSRGNKMAYANLAEVQKRLGRFEGARRSFQRALELDPGYVNGHNELGMLHLAMAEGALERADQEQADDHLRRAREKHAFALSLVPADQHRHRAEVLKRFAHACREHGFTQEAERVERLVEEELQAPAQASPDTAPQRERQGEGEPQVGA